MYPFILSFGSRLGLILIKLRERSNEYDLVISATRRELFFTLSLIQIKQTYRVADSLAASL